MTKLKITIIGATILLSLQVLSLGGGTVKMKPRSSETGVYSLAVVSTSLSYNLSQMSVEGQIRASLRANGLEHLTDTFIKVAFYESTMNPRAVGYASKPNHEFSGLFQIYTGTWNGYGCVGDIFNAMDNTACAVKIYRAEGFAPWEVFTDGLI